MSPRVLLAVAALLAACSSNSGGSESAGPTAQPPVIHSFAATPASIAPGASSVLAWNVTGATSLSIDQGVGPVTGTSVTVTPAATITYALTASNASGFVTASTAVTVAGAPAPSPATHRVSGALNVASGSEVDSDLNDTLNPNVPNDTAATAQRIGNPTTVGGYVNVAGAGEKGRTFEAGDPQDVFLVQLDAGQKVLLSIANLGTQASPNDLDLGLFDQNHKLVDSSLGTHDTESVTAPAAGTYFVLVSAYEGASNYSLSIGLAETPASAGPRLSDDFVPGEVVVQLRDDAAFRPGSARETASALGLTAKAGVPTRAMLMSVPAGTGRNVADAMLSSPVRSREMLSAYDGLPPASRRKWDTLMALKSLARRPDVRSAEPNFIARASATPNDQRYYKQWHYPLINLPQAWDVTQGSDSVVVAVVDTGVLLQHPDLQGKLTGGYDFIKDPESARDGDGIDANPDDPGDESTPGASSFHGTHVTGTIAAATNNSIGVAGIAWNVKVMPVRVLGLRGRGTGYDIIQGILYAAGLPNDSGTVPPKRADVINLSLGGSGFSQARQDAVNAARGAGAILVAASGNSNSADPEYPASCDGVVSVGAVDIEKKRAPYSNFGPTLDVVAPGGDVTKDLNGDGFMDGVLSTGGNDSGGTIQFVYKWMDGTSMATPHVAGVVALMKSVDPGLTPDKLDAWLSAGEITQDLGAPGRDDEFGYGLIDASRAVARAVKDAGGPAPANAVLSVTPASVNFGNALASAPAATAEISAVNGGSGALSIAPPTTSAPWLAVAAKDADKATGLGTYTVTGSRTGLAPGPYSGTVRFVPSVGDPVEVTVAMQVAAPGQEVAANAGFQHVLVVDPNSWATVAQFDALPKDGKYSFSFEKVPAGTWLLFSGSDFNNDGYICDSGESCGAYATLNSPSLVTVDRDLSSMDFPVAYVMWIATGASSAHGAAYPPRGLRLLHAGR